MVWFNRWSWSGCLEFAVKNIRISLSLSQSLSHSLSICHNDITCLWRIWISWISFGYLLFMNRQFLQSRPWIRWNRIRKCFCAPVLYQAFLEIGSGLGFFPMDHWFSINASTPPALTQWKEWWLIKSLYMPTFCIILGTLHCQKSLFPCRLLCFYTLWCGCRISKTPHWSADYRFLGGCGLRGSWPFEPCS